MNMDELVNFWAWSGL